MHGNKDLPKGTFYAILKQAGIDKEQQQIAEDISLKLEQSLEQYSQLNQL